MEVSESDEDEEKVHVNDGKPTSELKNGKMFMIDTNAKDPTTTDEIKETSEKLQRYGKFGEDDVEKVRQALGPFHYNHGQEIDRS